MVALLSMRVVPRAVPDLRFSIPAKFTDAHRLLRKDGFNHVVHAESIEDKCFKIFFVRNSQANARLGIIARKRILPGAVHRNYVKRVIREAFRQHDVKACKLDVVVMVRRAYSQGCGIRGDSLDVLFSRVKNRCAKL